MPIEIIPLHKLIFITLCDQNGYTYNNVYIGAFGNVKYAWLKDNTDAKFAIKAMKKNDIISSKHVDHIENEKKILEMISHPFIVSSNIRGILTFMFYR